MKDEKLSFRSFLAKFQWHTIVMGLTLVLSMYQYLFSTNRRIDTIIKLVSHVDEFNDIELGRFGIVYLNRLFGMQWYNPFLTAFLTQAVIVLTGVLLVYLLWRVTGGRHGAALFFMPLLIFLTPNWTEQLYFSYQTFLVLLGTAFTIIASYLVLKWIPSKNHRLLIVATALLFVAFSVYQSFVPLYMVLVFGWFLLECITDKKKDLSYFARTVVGHLIVGVVALVGYYLADKLANIGAVETDYLSKQFLWGIQPLHGVISSIIQSVGSIILARGLVDTWAYSLSAVASLVFLVMFLRKNKDLAMKGFILAAWLFLQLSGMALIFALGVRTYIRTELAITFVLAFNFLLCYLTAKDTFDGLREKRKHQAWVVLACAIGLLGLYINADLTFRLYYTDDIRNQRDQALAQSIIWDLKTQTSAENEEKAVVFLGEPKLLLDATCVESEVIGVSMFAYHDSCDSTNTIIMDYLVTSGFDCKRPEKADYQKAWAVLDSMTDYPLEGSILETDDVIVVRLSDDPYAGTDYLESGCEVSQLKPEEFVDTHLTQVDDISNDGETMTLQGFSLLRGTDASALHYQVLLADTATDRVYQVNTGCAQRLKVAKSYMEDNIKYDACGFVAKFPMELLNDESQSTYEVILHCTTDNGDSYFLKTNTYLNHSIVTKNPKTQ